MHSLYYKDCGICNVQRISRNPSFSSFLSILIVRVFAGCVVHMEVVEWSARLARSVSSSMPTSAIIYDAYTSTITQEEKSISMLDISRHLTRSKHWVSRFVLINFTLHLS